MHTVYLGRVNMETLHMYSPMMVVHVDTYIHGRNV
jgi:hypothetical protein